MTREANARIEARRLDSGAGTTDRLARFVADTRFEAMPRSAVQATKRIILDTIAVTIAAYDTKIAKALLAVKADVGGAPEATLMIDGRKIPAPNAAFIHAQLSNVLDADETLLNRSHTASAHVAAALAIGEKIGATGQEIIAAVAAGYDLTSRVGLSLIQYVPDETGKLVFAPVIGFSWMSFGVAAATGRLLGLGAGQIAEALGQAYVMTPVAYDVGRSNAPNLTKGTAAYWHKYQMAGSAAQAGIEAAQLVSHGWRARPDLFDEGSEFWRSFGSLGCNFGIFDDRLGERWLIEETSIKLYPFCRYGAGPLDLFGNIVAQHGLRADDIDEVKVRIAPVELTRQLSTNVTVDEDLKLMLSLPSAMALIVERVPPGPKWFHADLAAPELQRFAGKVHAEVDSGWNALLAGQMRDEGVFRRLPAEVTVRTGSAEFRASTEFTLGDPWAQGYALTDEQLVQKVRDYTDGILPPGKAEALIESVFALDRAPDVGAVARAMSR